MMYNTNQFPFSLEETAMLYQPETEGQGIVEYALTLILIAVVVIVILTVLGPAITNIFSKAIAQYN